MTVYVELPGEPDDRSDARDQGVELRDGDRPLAAIDRTVIVFP